MGVNFRRALFLVMLAGTVKAGEVVNAVTYSALSRRGPTMRTTMLTKF